MSVTSISTAILDQLVEGRDLEAKRSAGQDGQGELPRSFFETYSAFANTDGGVVLLGVEELEDGRLRVNGIADTQRVLKALWDGLNNPQRANVNLLRDADVETLEVEGKAVIRIAVARARRQDRPVYVGQNMFTGTYRRNNDGDYRCPEEVVRRMVAEQVEDSRDARVLLHYGMDDLDSATIAAYRRWYNAKLFEHPWVKLDDREFLQRIGAFGTDRESGKEALTAGGLLMFGKMVSLRDAFPNYMLDYQERTASGSEPRWVDRLTPDGTWSGNVFDFYGLVILRLFRDLKVPFMLRGDTRVEETPVHEALREALVNTLIHADYTGRISLLVVKRPDSFVFRNPGAMRMPVETALRGGVSDCRNRRLQSMFRYIGLGEQSGSGMPKIQAAWKAQQWRAPEMVEEVEPYEQTVFTLRMASLLPAEVVEALEREFGRAFAQTSEIQKLALVTAAVEHSVNHARLHAMTGAHPRDVTVALASLVQRGLLESGGSHKRTFYFLPGDRHRAEVTPLGFELPFSGVRPGPESTEGSSVLRPPSSVHNEVDSVHKRHGTVHEDVESELSEGARAMAAELRSRRRAPPEIVQNAIVRLCEERYLTLPELARLTGRTTETLRVHYVSKLLAEGRLELRFPGQPTHPGQAYRAARREDDLGQE
jgi:predicted HTH transcriptional regulator